MTIKIGEGRGGGIEQKGKGLMDMNNTVVIWGKVDIRGLKGNEKYNKKFF